VATYRASFIGGATSGSSDRTITFTPAAGDHLTAFVCTTDNTNNTPTASDNQSGTWSRVGCVAWSASAHRISVFVRDASPSAVSHTLTIATGSNTAGAIVVVAYSGMQRYGASSIRSSGSQANQAASSTPAPALNQAALTANATIAMVGSGDTTTTAAAGWTERQDTSQSTPTCAIEVCTRDSGFTGTTITFGATQSTVYASFAIELDTSAPPITGTAAITEAGETTAGAAAVLVAATAAITETGETVSGAADVLVAGTAAIADAGETVAGEGTVSSSSIEGTAAITETGETVASSAAVLVAGTAAITEAGETAAGQASALVGATAAITDGAETAAGAASVRVEVTAAITDMGEVIAAVAVVEGGDIEGTAAITDGPELAVGEAFVTPLPEAKIRIDQLEDHSDTWSDAAFARVLLLPPSIPRRRR
jgi:hypothetical protein